MSLSKCQEPIGSVPRLSAVPSPLLLDSSESLICTEVKQWPGAYYWRICLQGVFLTSPKPRADQVVFLEPVPVNPFKINSIAARYKSDKQSHTLTNLLDLLVVADTCSLPGFDLTICIQRL